MEGERDVVGRGGDNDDDDVVNLVNKGTFTFALLLPILCNGVLLVEIDDMYYTMALTYTIK